MANLNCVHLIGRLTRDPELRSVSVGGAVKAVVEFGMAMNRKRKDAEEATFVDLTAWARDAEVIAQYCRKGDPLYVQGRLKMDKWETREGEKRQKLCIVVEDFQLLSSRQETDEDALAARPAPVAAPAAVETDPFADDDIPF